MDLSGWRLHTGLLGVPFSSFIFLHALFVAFGKGLFLFSAHLVLGFLAFMSFEHHFCSAF